MAHDFMSFKLAVLFAFIAEATGLLDKQIPIIIMQSLQCTAWVAATIAALYSVYSSYKKNKKNKLHDPN